MIMTRTILVSALIGFTCLSPIAAHAQDKEAPKAEKPAEKKIDLKTPTKTEAQSAKAGPTGKLKEWMDAENKLIDPLALKDQESIFILRNKHSMMKVTRVVEGDIENAVESCGKHNPDIKDKMEGRFKQWQSAVNPILESAEKQLDKDIDAQKIVDAGDFEDVLDLHDEAYEEGEKQTVKQPVTTKEACEGLLASMDGTEDNMIQILQQTLLPESAIRKRAAEVEKTRAATQRKNLGKKPPEAPKPAEAAKTP
jgi:hypothetical protein